jgi:hypothetical protein
MKWIPAGRSGSRERKPDWIDEHSREAEVRPGFRPRKAKAKPPANAKPPGKPTTPPEAPKP